MVQDHIGKHVTGLTTDQLSIVSTMPNSGPATVAFGNPTVEANATLSYAAIRAEYSDGGQTGGQER